MWRIVNTCKQQSHLFVRIKYNLFIIQVVCYMHDRISHTCKNPWPASYMYYTCMAMISFLSLIVQRTVSNFICKKKKDLANKLVANVPVFPKPFPCLSKEGRKTCYHGDRSVYCIYNRGPGPHITRRMETLSHLFPGDMGIPLWKWEPLYGDPLYGKSSITRLLLTWASLYCSLAEQREREVLISTSYVIIVGWIYLQPL